MSGGGVTAESRVALDIPADHPAFDGHFPGFPLLPGAVLLDAALDAIAAHRDLDLTRWRLTSAKFLALVRPGACLILGHTASDDRTIRFDVRRAGDIVASGMLSHGA